MVACVGGWSTFTERAKKSFGGGLERFGTCCVWLKYNIRELPERRSLQHLCSFDSLQSKYEITDLQRKRLDTTLSFWLNKAAASRGRGRLRGRQCRPQILHSCHPSPAFLSKDRRAIRLAPSAAHGKEMAVQGFVNDKLADYMMPFAGSSRQPRASDGRPKVLRGPMN